MEQKQIAAAPIASPKKQKSPWLKNFNPLLADMLKDWRTYSIIPLLLAQLSIAAWRYDTQQRKQHARKIAHVAVDSKTERASSVRFASSPPLPEGIAR